MYRTVFECGLHHSCRHNNVLRIEACFVNMRPVSIVIIFCQVPTDEYPVTRSDFCSVAPCVSEDAVCRHNALNVIMFLFAAGSASHDG